MNQNLKICKNEFDEKNIKTYWTKGYEKLKDPKTSRKIFQSSIILQSNEQVHVFCQRAVRDLMRIRVSANGRFSQETIDAINFTIESGFKKQFRQTVAHYTANFIQLQVSQKKYGKFLKELFD